MPKLTDAHRGPLTPQSAQKRFSVSFNCLRRRFKLESQSSLLVGGLAVKENDAMFSLCKVACVRALPLFVKMLDWPTPFRSLADAVQW